MLTYINAFYKTAEVSYVGLINDQILNSLSYKITFDCDIHVTFSDD